MGLMINMLEIRVSVLHMNVMRSNVKRGFKSRYKKEEVKQLIETYDSIKNTLQALLDSESHNETEEMNIYFEESELNVFHAFVSWYVSELKNKYEAAEKATGKKRNEEDQQNLNILIDIQSKLEVLLYANV